MKHSAMQDFEQIKLESRPRLMKQIEVRIEVFAMNVANAVCDHSHRQFNITCSDWVHRLRRPDGIKIIVSNPLASDGLEPDGHILNAIKLARDKSLIRIAKMRPEVP